jgi:thiol-disulfide isomerase/thioredoxin
MKTWLLLALLALVPGIAAAQHLDEWHDREAIAAAELIPATGKAVHIGDFRGKVVVVDFWGAWCGSCLSEMRSLKDLQHALAERGDGVVFLFVSADDHGFAADNAWFAKSGLDGANYRWVNRTGAQYHAFFGTSNARWWAPDTLILDTQGNVAKWVMGGGTDWTKEEGLLRRLVSAPATGTDKGTE